MHSTPKAEQGLCKAEAQPRTTGGRKQFQVSRRDTIHPEIRQGCRMGSKFPEDIHLHQTKRNGFLQLSCVWAQFNCLSLGDTFGEFASRYPMDLPLGCMHSEVSARFRSSPISACCFLSCILSQAAQTGHWNAAFRSRVQCTGVLMSAATIPSAQPTGTGERTLEAVS